MSLSTCLFSSKNRPMHAGPYPTELLQRSDDTVIVGAIPYFEPLFFSDAKDLHSIINAMREHQAMLDAIRDGLINKATADPLDRANQLKAFAYFADATDAGYCTLSDAAILRHPPAWMRLFASATALNELCSTSLSSNTTQRL